jgi:hypothetical protein
VRRGDLNRMAVDGLLLFFLLFLFFFRFLIVLHVVHLVFDLLFSVLFFSVRRHDFIYSAFHVTSSSPYHSDRDAFALDAKDQLDTNRVIC